MKKKSSSSTKKKKEISKIPKVGELKSILTEKHPLTNKVSHTKVLYSYKNVEYDIDGWADVNKYLPYDFDLVFMRLERNRTIPGWISGNTWNGIRLKSDDKVLYWKRKQEMDA